MSTLHLDHSQPARSVSFSHISDALHSAGQLLSTWTRRATHRREMRDLLRHDNRLLQDIGLRREEVMHEAFKAFWRE